MSQQNKQLVKDWIEKKLQGQGNPFDDLDSGVVFVIPGAKDNPLFGKFEGVEEVQRFFSLLQAKLLEKNLSQTLEVTNFVAEGNRVIVLLEEVFISKNESTESCRNSAAWLFELNDDQKIFQFYCYDNTLVTSGLFA